MKRETKLKFGHSHYIQFFRRPQLFRKQDSQERVQTKRDKDTNVDSVHYNSDKGGFVHFCTTGYVREIRQFRHQALYRVHKTMI